MRPVKIVVLVRKVVFLVAFVEQILKYLKEKSWIRKIVAFNKLNNDFSMVDLYVALNIMALV